MVLFNQVTKLTKSLLRFDHVNLSSKYMFFHTNSARFTFWERDPKGGYNRDIPKRSTKEIIRHGLNQIKEEIQLWQEEVVDKFESDPIIALNPGEVHKVWEFSSNKDLEKWIVTSDKDQGEGQSTCSLEINNHGKGLFSGILNTQLPKDGVIKRTGYCNMRSVRVKKSFQRDSFYDWGMYTHLVLRVRGDGRSYFINLATSGYFDQLWNDSYHYILFTRGGPYWQVARIPFSKFFFTSKGRIQDLQFPIPLSSISNLGISLSDKASGPFYLEIDYIGLEMDLTHTEKFAYEQYKVPSFLAAN